MNTLRSCPGLGADVMWKHQASNIKHPTSTKLQTPIGASSHLALAEVCGLKARWRLVLGAWYCFDVWVLVFGASSSHVH
jgi:hypothetical protein